MTNVVDVKVPMSFDEAQEHDAASGKYFKPEVNKDYKLTFSNWQLYMKKVPNYNNPDTLEDKVILELSVDSINDKPVQMEWSIMSQKCRSAFEMYCKVGSITKKIFLFKSKGEAQKRTYQVAEVGDKEVINIK